MKMNRFVARAGGVAFAFFLAFSLAFRAFAPALAGPAASGTVPLAAALVAPGGGANDGPAITAALIRGPVQLAPGLYTVATPIVVPSGARLDGTPSTVIRSTITPTPGGGYLAALFLAVDGTLSSPFVSTFASNTVGGAHTISLAACPPVGAWLELTGAASNVAQFVRVISVSGSGPCAVTIDRGVIWPAIFTAGQNVVQVAPVVGAELHGHGMTVSGTGDRAWEANCVGCLVEGVNVDARYGAFGSIVMSMDLGSTDSTFRDIRVDSAGGSQAGLALESNYRSRIDNCHVSNVGSSAANAGVYITDSTDCDVTAYTEGCSVGLLINTGSNASTAGSRRVRVLGGAYNSSLSYGATITSPEIDLLGTSFAFNVVGVQVSYGSAVGGADGAPVRLVGVRGYGNTGALLTIGAGDVHAVDLVSRDDGLGTYAVAVTGNAGNFTMTGGTLTLTADHFWYGVYLDGSGRVALGGGLRIELPVAHTNAHAGLVVQGSSVVELGQVAIVNGYYQIYLYGAGATLRRGSLLSLIGSSNSNTSVTITSGSTDSSWGTAFGN